MTTILLHFSFNVLAMEVSDICKFLVKMSVWLLVHYCFHGIFSTANTAIANSYQLLGVRFGWKKTVHKKYKLNFYAGVDNLLNETYSLGNDINAAANRFYNAAPPRNYYAGLSFQWIRLPVK